MTHATTPSPPAVTRFAPSPTGHLHIGGARTALFCAALARRLGGRFLLRIEDTDQKRSSESAAAGILEDLAWLGIDWDDGPVLEHGGRRIGGDPRGVGPFFQSQRLEIYQRHVRRLLERGLAYPAFETADELAAMRQAAEAQKRTFVYRRPEGYDHPAALARAAREEHVVRFRMPPEPITVNDRILGAVTFPHDELEDLVIVKRDGFPTYHFAVVVDDELMGVTHVVRGQEHLNNTPRHVALIGAMGFRLPEYAHLPLIFNPDGSKMSKRDKDKAVRGAVKQAGFDYDAHGHIGDGAWPTRAEFDRWLSDKTVQLETMQLVTLGRRAGLTDLPQIDVEDFRRSGFLPEVVVNYIALLGWNPGEKTADGKDLERFDRAYLDGRFDLARVGKTASKFDRDKLRAFNFQTIQAMEPAAFVAAWRAWAARYEPGLLEALPEVTMLLLAPAVQQRAAVLSEASRPVAFILINDDAATYDQAAITKHLHAGEPTGLSLLAAFRDELVRTSPFEPAAIEAAVSRWCESRGVGLGKLAQPIRVALTGAAVSPPLGVTLTALGRDRVLRRIDRLLGVAAG
jgi:glutamyl-tRNA synthetase